jgi:hypothetical protein
MAWWPGMIGPGQTVGDIIHETDLFTKFAHLGGATQYLPTDPIIDGIDQTALFLKGDTFSRRDYVLPRITTCKARAGGTQLGGRSSTPCPTRHLFDWQMPRP